MSDNPLALLQQAGGALQVPAELHSLMQDMQSSELQANVGASYAVVTIKGKVFSIKYGGTNTPITVNMNGTLYAAPYFDVVIPKAKAELSKTYYPNGYTEGSDDAPTCWAEDGVNPLGPTEQRPIDPMTGTHCVDCRMCPMNQFGSKISESGGKGKACADTRKLIVVPMAPTGQKNPDGSDATVMDGANIKFGGPMLLRVPAASLRVFGEYDAKLQQMGLPYFGVVTRLEFDQTQAYPKFVLRALRVITPEEANKVVEIRDSMLTRQILESGQTGAAPRAALPAPSVSAVAGAQAPQVLQSQMQPVPPQPTVTPQPIAPSSNVLPFQPTPPAPPVPVAPAVQAAPMQAPFPPDGWLPHPTAPGFFYRGQEVVSETDLRAQAAPAAPQVPAAPQQVPLQLAPQPAAIVPPSGPAPSTPGPQVTPALMSTVDQLLSS